MRSFLRRYRVESLLFLAFWVSFACFFHLIPGWNVNSRISLTFAIVDRETLFIDQYFNNPLTETQDLAYYGGHFYCDKAPGLSFLAVPFYAIIKPILDRSSSEMKVATARQWCTIWTVGLLGALGASIFFRVLRMYGAAPREAIPLTFFLFYGTNLGGYTSLFYSYVPGTAALLGAYALILSARARGIPLTRKRAFAIGFLVSSAGLLEFIFGWAGLVLLTLAFVTLKPRNRFAWTILGALPPVIVLFLYCWAIFGLANIDLPYHHEYRKEFQDAMNRGALGIHTPSLVKFIYITFHPFKGIFFYSPILLFFFLGSLWTRRLGPWMADLIAAWAIVLGYLYVNSSYTQWWGGWSMGARHLIPMLPWMFLPILAAMRRHPRVSSIVMLAGCLSVLLNIPPIVVDPQIPAGYEKFQDQNGMPYLLLDPKLSYNFISPWLTDIIPRFRRGDIAVNPFIGFLPGLWSLLPLALLWFGVLKTSLEWAEADPAAGVTTPPRGRV